MWKEVARPTCDVIKEPNLKATGLLELYEETQDQFGNPPPFSTTNHKNEPSRTLQYYFRNINFKFSFYVITKGRKF